MSSFVTIPDPTNIPIMVNIEHIESVTILETGELQLNMVSGNNHLTLIPRDVLVTMLMKKEEQPKVVTTHQEWAG